jgi:hypothetical protein
MSTRSITFEKKGEEEGMEIAAARFEKVKNK